MKLTSFIFVITVFAAACASWTPSAAEVALSAKEDARETALWKIVNSYVPAKL